LTFDLENYFYFYPTPPVWEISTRHAANAARASPDRGVG